jgi:hypothetical protein
LFSLTQIAENQIAIISGIVAILATAGIVGSYNVQTAEAENDFGKAVSDIAHDDPRSLGLGDGSTGECGGDGCSDDDTGNSGKQFGKDVSGVASKNK